MLLVLAPPPALAQNTAPKAAVFPFEFIDSGQSGPVSQPQADEKARLDRASELLASRLSGSGLYAPVDLTAQKPLIEKAPALRDCQRCANEIALQAGAEIAVVGYVQKVSNLILNINVTISNARSGQVLTAASADIRGNTDESWTRGLEWLLKNRLLARKQP